MTTNQDSQHRNQYWWLLWLIPIFGIGLALFSIHETDHVDWKLWDTIPPIFSDELTGDWIASEGGYVLSWWFITTLAGIAVFPLLFRLLNNLPDRGFSVMRPAGLMLTGFIYWFSTSLTLTRNDVGSIVFGWICVLLISILSWVFWDNRPTFGEVVAWFKDNISVIIIAEVLFAVLFLAWAFVQAHHPEFRSTEKPMEMAFISGIRNSEFFPPKDPWLAGYSISYYYFGYVIIAALADISSVATPIAFNLMTALVFAMTGVGVMGLLYNLVRNAGPSGKWRRGSHFSAIGIGLSAMLMVLFMGHLSTFFVELPYRNYDVPLVDQLVEIDEDYFDYWDMRNRSVQPTDIANDSFPHDDDRDGIKNWEDDLNRFDDGGWTFWWWFAHSRVVQDRNLDGQLFGEPIVEFPNFSFILSDNHPHVLALPFAVLALTLLTGMVLRREDWRIWEIAIYAIFIGGMVFMNAWDAIYIVLIIGGEVLRRLLMNGRGQLSGLNELLDLAVATIQKIASFFGEKSTVITASDDAHDAITQRAKLSLQLLPLAFVILLFVTVIAPISIFAELGTLIGIVFSLAFSIPLAIIINWMFTDSDWAHIAKFAAFLGLFTYIFYLPWQLTFTSQANGIYPNILHPTRYQQFFLQFGIFAIIIAAFVFIEFLRASDRLNWYLMGTILMVGIIIIVAVPYASTYVIDSRCDYDTTQIDEVNRLPEGAERDACDARRTLFGGLSEPDQSFNELAGDVLSRRQAALPNQIFLLLIIAFGAGRLFGSSRRDLADGDEKNNHLHPSVGIALLMLSAAAVIVFFPDLAYIRDNFNRRMNTIFKMYYQGWLLFSVVAAYGFYYLISRNPHTDDDNEENPIYRSRQAIFSISFVILVTLGMLYPYYAIRERYIYETGYDNTAADARPLTLDGTSTSLNEGEAAAMACLLDLEPYGSDSRLAEATLDNASYNLAIGRFSTMTGIPNLMGWENHQRQWRGDTYYEIDGVGADQRQRDLEILFSTRDLEQSKSIIERYDIDYLVVGVQERQIYGASGGLDKFAQAYDPVCQETTENGDVIVSIYNVSAE